MKIDELRQRYSALPQCGAFLATLADTEVRSVFLDGLVASAAPLFFSALSHRSVATFVFILNDADDAGYFYHDLTQVLGTADVLFFPPCGEVWPARRGQRNIAYRGAE